MKKKGRTIKKRQNPGPPGPVGAPGDYVDRLCPSSPLGEATMHGLSKTRYSPKEVAEMMKRQYDNLVEKYKKEPNLTDAFEEAKRNLADCDQEVAYARVALEKRLDEQAEAKRCVQEAADALVRAAKEATR